MPIKQVIKIRTKRIEFLVRIFMISQAIQLTNLFEHGEVELKFNNVENDEDGRGWTCGLLGYTSEEAYYFKDYFSKSDWSLKNTKMPEQWANACKNPDFIKKQLEVLEKEFGSVAEQAFRNRGCVHNLTLAAFYDTVVQHGAGDDLDSFGAILKSWSKSKTEKENLKNFLKVRKNILKHAHNQSTRKTWADSVSRVDVLEALLITNIDLHYPLQIKSKDYNLTIKM